MKVNMHEAKTQLSKLGEAAVAGEEVIIAKNGKPYLRLIRYEEAKPSPRKAGLYKGKGWIADSFFDESDELAALFEGDGQ